MHSFAKYLYSPASIAEIFELYTNHEDVVILGNGSNVILTKARYEETAFIVIKDDFKQIFQVDEGIYAQAGCLLKSLSMYAYKHFLSGIETFFDVPASVGGAMIMNTSAYGDEIYDHVVYVDVIDTKYLKHRRIYKPDINYGYRYSMFKNAHFIILGACFGFSSKPQVEIKKKMDTIVIKRQSKLPNEPSAGSVFKRPKYNITVGEMVENVGLKGFQIGGAKVSIKHGGVIVNIGNATGKDILQVIDHIKKSIMIHYQVELDLEQILV